MDRSSATNAKHRSHDTCEKLLKKIISCQYAHDILNQHARGILDENLHGHACYDVVTSQESLNPKEWQVPEPFVGDPNTARLVFISSNPSYDRDEKFPTWNNNIDPVDFFINRFQNHVDEKFRVVLQNKSANHRKRPVHFWTSMHNQACRLFYGEEIKREKAHIRPGKDYLYTEVVHCKSCNEKGVEKAVERCIEEYFFEVLDACNNARIFVLVGCKALEYAAPFFTKDTYYKINMKKEDIISALESSKMLSFSGCKDSCKKQYLLWLPHPSSSQKVKNCLKRFDANTLQQIKEVLNEDRG